MREFYCHIDFDQQREQSKFLMRRDAEYWMDSHRIHHERTFYGINPKYLFCIICFIAALSLAVILCAYTLHASSRPAPREPEASEVPVEDTTPALAEHPVETPTIYDRCSADYLSYEDAWALYEQSGPAQLQFCINLIYARHGYFFGEGNKNDIYFSKQEWYQNLEKKDVTYEDLNAYEQKNVSLFVKILEAEGYRQPQ
mgnify:CR=1 FL=1